MSIRRKPIGRIPNQIIKDLWHGSIDMHIHPGPDPACERPYDSIQIARRAQETGMAGIVLKSFFYPTGSDAFNIQTNITPDLKVFGSVVIAYATTGGLTYAAKTIELQAKIGAKVVWFPAMDAKWCQNYLGHDGGIYILDENGKLKPEVIDILNIVKKYNMVLCSGHMSFEETSSLFDTAIDMGIVKLVATHPLAELSRYSKEQIHILADKGAYIEHVYGTLLPRNGGMDPSDYVDCIKEIGAERSLLGSDLAQVWDPMPADGMRHFIAMMIQFGCTPEEVELMVKINPRKLLDI